MEIEKRPSILMMDDNASRRVFWRNAFRMQKVVKIPPDDYKLCADWKEFGYLHQRYLPYKMIIVADHRPAIIKMIREADPDSPIIALGSNPVAMIPAMAAGLTESIDSLSVERVDALIRKYMISEAA